MIRVVEVSSDTNIGGAGKCLITLAREYNREEFEMIVVLPKDSLLKPEIEQLGVQIYEVDGIAEKSLSWSSVKTLKKLFRHIKPDVVHTHASMAARIAARFAGAKVVYTRHSVFPQPKKLTRPPGKWINGAINNYFSDAIIAVAEAAKENLTDTGVNPDKISVILNGVQPLTAAANEEKAQIRSRFGIGQDEKVISIVARLEDIKGHDYFIEAADLLKKKGYHAKFVIAGTGSYEAHLKQKAASMGLSDTVLFTGFISDVDKLMNITDIQANASFGTEATSLALLEGMSLGIPAVVSDFGGNPGVIKDGANGFVVPKQNSAALADGIERLLTDHARYEKVSRRAKEMFEEIFTAQAMTRKTEELYKQVTGGKTQ